MNYNFGLFLRKIQSYLKKNNSSLPEITEHLGCKACVLWLSNRAQTILLFKKNLIHSG